MDVSYEEFLAEKLEQTTFFDAFDIKELQELQDVLANSVQIASIITAVDGTPLTKPSNFCDLCKNYVRKTKLGQQRCEHSDAVIGDAKPGEYKIARCLSAGLLDAGVSIMLGEKRIASWIFGQVRDDQDYHSLEQLQAKAEELGIDAEEFVRAYENVVQIPAKRFEYIARLVSKISVQISEQAYQRCAQRADEEYRALLAEELNEQKKIAEYNSTIDELTKLHNRNYFENKLEQLDMLGVTPVTVIAGDVNHLKLTNDIFGHRYGDVMLSEIASVMIDEAFDGYIICRCGGDEFNVIIPNANRQEAEWYIRRIRLELQKKNTCCFMPSIAFGVAKKSHKQEQLKDIMEFADCKMYEDKIHIKEKEDLLDSLKRALFARGYLTPEYHENTISMARRFGTYLGWEEQQIKLLTRAVRIQDYGLIALNRDVFLHRLDKKPPIAYFREINKHPQQAYKIAQLNENYAYIADDVLAHEEQWDGKGYPAGLEGENIPLKARIGRIVGDYNTYIAQSPIGYGMSENEARKKILDGKGTLFDPYYAEAFVDFLKKEQEQKEQMRDK